ncbi:fimbria/pilus outer membrane usher protein [Enterobacter bugandensis]|uniref:fimbria/pilus outer membrane usher protein n=1 Tax=Enterobacter bugandensis TaxID=881260 RepID=UPI0022E09639|nr:fimbria/pilus outer membrane usher protein [Enterobacter bugandensis]
MSLNSALPENVSCRALNPPTQALLLALALGGSTAAAAQGSVPASADTKASEEASLSATSSTSVTDFNTDVLDVNDRASVDVSHFARAGYVMPGEYPLTLAVNGTEIREVTVTFAPPVNDPQGSEPCLTEGMVSLFGLKSGIAEKLKWMGNGAKRCLDVLSLPGMTANGELSTGTLKISLPQAYLEYSAPDWDPPSRWDEGVAGLLFDYNLNAMQTKMHDGDSSQSLSGNGTAGLNLGPWRLRADWQASRYSSGGQSSQNMEWSRYYLYRALPGIGAKLTLGESDLDSSLFDSFRFLGASLATDDSMLPPNLQGYAPEVTGVARTNAKVTISQQGRVIYQSQVAPGPFRIQELSQATTGTLDVKVEEQDGRVQNFKVDTASIPYLTRPGMVRYKTAAGRPTDWKHRVQGDPFATGEFSWGVSNGWSLFGGLVAAKQYAALAVGIGRDLLALGALSFDVTESRARLPGGEETKTGGSYRLSYSKRFEKIDGQVTFAGYRFSEKDYMSMSDYLEARYHDSAFGMTRGRQKELYTISVSKAFRDLKMNLYGNYSHRTYWDRPDSDRYSLTLSQYLDIGSWKNISLSLTGYKSEAWGVKDDGIYASVNVPFGNGGSLSYSGQSTRNGTSQMAGWYDTIDANNNYNIQAGTGSDNKAIANGYFSHRGDMANGTLSASYSEGSYRSVGMSLQGGITATRYGAALHPAISGGGTRLMLDTGDATGVPVNNSGVSQKTNQFGKAVVAGLGNYWRNSIGIDVNALSEDMEVSHPLTELTMTEGAIGYRKIDVLQGRKLMAVIKYADGSSPSFGSVVWRGTHQTGVVDDAGSVWLAGVKSGVEMEVRENEQPVCGVKIPDRLPAVDTGMPLLLTCRALSVDARTVKTTPDKRNGIS